MVTWRDTSPEQHIALTLLLIPKKKICKDVLYYAGSSSLRTGLCMKVVIINKAAVGLLEHERACSLERKTGSGLFQSRHPY